jgi:predicted RNase H-like HicB family nuclease
MGQLLEWPEVVSEGATLEECRVMVEDAALEMLHVYEEDGLPVPQGHAILETIAIG